MVPLKKFLTYIYRGFEWLLLMNVFFIGYLLMLVNFLFIWANSKIVLINILAILLYSVGVFVRRRRSVRKHVKYVNLNATKFTHVFSGVLMESFYLASSYLLVPLLLNISLFGGFILKDNTSFQAQAQIIGKIIDYFALSFTLTTLATIPLLLAAIFILKSTKKSTSILSTLIFVAFLIAYPIILVVLLSRFYHIDDDSVFNILGKYNIIRDIFVGPPLLYYLYLNFRGSMLVEKLFLKNNT